MSSAPDRSAAVVVIPAWGLAALGLLAAVANANFLLRRPVGSSFDPVTSEISLLSVAGQPGAWAFRAADTAAGLAAVLLALASAAVTTNFRGSRRVYGRLLAVSLGAFGIGTVASAIVTLSCAMSAQCVASPARDSVHDALSVVATLGTVVGCILLLRLRAGRASRGAVAGEALLAAAVTGLAALQVIYWLGGLPGGSGLVQRGQVLATSIWFALVGLLLARFTGGVAWRASSTLGGPARAPAVSPMTGAPAQEFPIGSELTTAQAPTAHRPTTDPPTTDLPTTDLPTTDLPTTDLPTTDLPTTDLPTTDLPTGPTSATSPELPAAVARLTRPARIAGTTPAGAPPPRAVTHP